MSNLKKQLDLSVERNSYEGNGWSKYQLMVLQQLDDHNKILQNLNQELVDIKQNVAVSETELKMWRAQIMSSVEKLTDQVDEILYEESGLGYKVRNLVQNNEIEEKANLKTKAMWATIGAVIAFFMSVITKAIEFFWK